MKLAIIITMLVMLIPGCANVQTVYMSEVNQKNLADQGIEPGRHVRISLKSGETIEYEVVALEENAIVGKFPKRISGLPDRRVPYSEIDKFKIKDRAPVKTAAVISPLFIILLLGAAAAVPLAF